MNDFAKSCISNVDAEGFNFAVKLNAVFETCGDGYWSEAVKQVEVTEMGMYVGSDEDGYSGDFYVLYEETTWNDDEDGLIYTDSAFLDATRLALADALVKMGFDVNVAQELADAVNYSEQGMQDYGRVSFDAYELAEALRGFYATVVA